MRTLSVDLGASGYDILIDSGILSSLGSMCAEAGLGRTAAVVTNPTVNPLYGETVMRSLEGAGISCALIVIPDGEQYKTAGTLETVYDRLIDAGLDRSSFIVALGGGVVGDLAGYAAATYLRGVPFVQVPTTLLAQVDSSVGGKTAIDHPKGKNLIGAFHQPRLVLIDVAVLATLPPREFRAGMAEVVKYGAVLDADFFAWLESHAARISAGDPHCLAEVIRRCCSLKAGIVEMDEKESGPRAVLNYGHTLGHAFETLSDYQSLLHGEAVAIGMVLASRISSALGHCTDRDAARITELLALFGLPVAAPASDPVVLSELLVRDKKARSGSISFICNRGIGGYAVERRMPDELVRLAGLGRGHAGT